MLSLGIYGIILSGWASRQPVRPPRRRRGAPPSSSPTRSALGLSLVGLIMVYPSLRLSEIVRFQGEHRPRLPARAGASSSSRSGFVLFFIAALAETKRVPFDMPEGESEIIGFFTEYGGLKWGLFMMTDFMEILVVSALLTTLFFGGWQVPWLAADGFHWPWGGHLAAGRAGSSSCLPGRWPSTSRSSSSAGSRSSSAGPTRGSATTSSWTWAGSSSSRSSLLNILGTGLVMSL